ncbi:hypothetical protein ACFWPP_12725 [Streptomyces anulatus]|uniref:hypothetical protein n=1 Tax=Streptomyces anulatus TaxID=1892 RepID=UPI00366735E0
MNRRLASVPLATVAAVTLTVGTAPAATAAPSADTQLGTRASDPFYRYDGGKPLSSY